MCRIYFVRICKSFHIPHRLLEGHAISSRGNECERIGPIGYRNGKRCWLADWLVVGWFVGLPAFQAITRRVPNSFSTLGNFTWKFPLVDVLRHHNHHHQHQLVPGPACIWKLFAENLSSTWWLNYTQTRSCLLGGGWNEIGRAVKIRPQIGNVTAINYLYNCAADYPDPTYGEFARIPQPNSLLNLSNFNCD